MYFVPARSLSMQTTSHARQKFFFPCTRSEWHLSSYSNALLNPRSIFTELHSGMLGLSRITLSSDERRRDARTPVLLSGNISRESEGTEQVSPVLIQINLSELRIVWMRKYPFTLHFVRLLLKVLPTSII